MTNYVPLLLQGIAGAGGLPHLVQRAAYGGKGPAEEAPQAESSIFEFARQTETLETGGYVSFALAQEYLTLLEPVPFSAWIQSDDVGMPIFTAPELAEFLAGVLVVDEPPDVSRWYEFSQVQNGSFLMYPNDNFPDSTFQLLVPVRSSPTSTQLRRVLLDMVSTLEIPGNRASLLGAVRSRIIGMKVVNQPCTISAVNAAGAPYRGSCEAITCHQVCKPNVVFRQSNGNYTLTECKCPAE